MKLPPPPPLSGPALRALVAAAEAPGTGTLVFAMMTKQMGIDVLDGIPAADEPLPIDERVLPLPGSPSSRSGT